MTKNCNDDKDEEDDSVSWIFSKLSRAAGVFARVKLAEWSGIHGYTENTIVIINYHFHMDCKFDLDNSIYDEKSICHWLRKNVPRLASFMWEILEIEHAGFKPGFHFWLEKADEFIKLFEEEGLEFESLAEAAEWRNRLDRLKSIHEERRAGKWRTTTPPRKSD
jgi:hypothetical protein